MAAHSGVSDDQGISIDPNFNVGDAIANVEPRVQIVSGQGLPYLKVKFDRAISTPLSVTDVTPCNGLGGATATASLDPTDSTVVLITYDQAVDNRRCHRFDLDGLLASDGGVLGSGGKDSDFWACYLEGDVNQDGIVDIINDYQEIYAGLGPFAAAGAAGPRLDLDRSGMIDYDDAAFTFPPSGNFEAVFDTSGDCVAPCCLIETPRMLSVRSMAAHSGVSNDLGINFDLGAGDANIEPRVQDGPVLALSYLRVKFDQAISTGLNGTDVTPCGGLGGATATASVDASDSTVILITYDQPVENGRCYRFELNGLPAVGGGILGRDGEDSDFWACYLEADVTQDGIVNSDDQDQVELSCNLAAVESAFDRPRVDLNRSGYVNLIDTQHPALQPNWLNTLNNNTDCVLPCCAGDPPQMVSVESVASHSNVSNDLGISFDLVDGTANIEPRIQDGGVLGLTYLRVRFDKSMSSSLDGTDVTPCEGLGNATATASVDPSDSTVVLISYDQAVGDMLCYRFELGGLLATDGGVLGGEGEDSDFWACYLEADVNQDASVNTGDQTQIALPGNAGPVEEANDAPLVDPNRDGTVDSGDSGIAIQNDTNTLANDTESCALDCGSGVTIEECSTCYGLYTDCQFNGVPDVCDIASGQGGYVDVDLDGIPDHCNSGKVDLDVDSDNDDATRLPERSFAEENVEAVLGGKIVWLNDDDDNFDTQRDFDEAWGIVDENDLVPLVVDFWPQDGGDATVSYLLDFDDQAIRLWLDPTRGVLPAGTPLRSEHTVGDDETVQHEVRILGDMDSNGVLDSADVAALDAVIAVVNSTIITTSPSDEDLNVGDLNEDGAVTFVDKTILLAHIGSGTWRYVPVHLWIEAIDIPLDANISITVLYDLNKDGNPSGGEPLDTVELTITRQFEDCQQWGEGADFWSDAGVHTGDSCGEEGFRSKCFAADNKNTQEWQDNARWSSTGEYGGHGFHVDVSIGSNPPDLPPLSRNPLTGTLPIYNPRESQNRSGDSHPERATQSGVIDLMTGLPLLRDVDFELSFGGAVFRHTRTYSHVVSDTYALLPEYTDKFLLANSTRQWDWNGAHWSMGENPLFLIDARYEDVVPTGVKRCYLVPDAHHSIPFEWVSGSNNYVAPASFDALLDHDGQMNTETGEWEEGKRPTVFKVWLDGGAIQYTIKPIYEDLPNRYDDVTGELVNQHAAPEDGGRGAPYYGLTTEISDRHGNRARMHYCDFGEFECDAPDTSSCTECCQNCREKGQLKAVTLHPAGSPDTEATWTILYVHRELDELAWNAFDDPAVSTIISASRDNRLHSIHVYEGFLDPDSYPCMTLEQEAFFQQANPGALPTPFDSLDEYDDVDAVAILGLPAGATKTVKYMYEESIGTLYHDWESGGQSGIWTAKNGQGQRWLGAFGALKKVTSYAAGEEAARRTVYVYSANPHRMSALNSDAYHMGPSNTSQVLALRGVFYEHSLQEIVKNPELGASSENIVFESNLDDILDYADLRFEGEGDILQDTMIVNRFESTIESLGFRLDDILYPRDTFPITFTDDRENSENRAEYVFWGFQVFPESIRPPKGDPTFAWTSAVAYAPQRTPTLYYWYPSIFKYPYRVKEATYYRDGDVYEGTTLATPELDMARFVMVVDERIPDTDYRPEGVTAVAAGGSGSLDNIILDATYDLDNPPGIRSRRVVEINATGQILRKREWTFDDAGTIGFSQMGTGVDQRFDCKGRLLETRTRSWNAALVNPNADETSEGLIVVNTYDTDYCNYDSDLDRCVCDNLPLTTSEEDVIYEPTAVGMKKGTAGTVRYISHVDRHPDRSELVTSRVDFPIPVTDLTSTGVGEITLFDYEFVDDDPEKGISKKTVTRAAIPREPGGTPQAGTEITVYDDEGKDTWFGWGSGTPGNWSEFYFNHKAYDNMSRPTLTVIDADQSYGPPDGWARTSPAAAPALNLTTTYDYDPQWGLIKVVYPNDRERHIVYKTDPGNPQALEVWDYPAIDLAINPAEGNQVVAPVKATRIEGDKVQWAKELRITQLAAYPPEGTEWDGIDQTLIISDVNIEYDSSGNPASVTQSTGDGATSLSSSIRLYVNGQPERVSGPDGTISWSRFDNEGRLRATYRGTSDEHEEWGVLAEGQAAPCSSLPQGTAQEIAAKEDCYNDYLVEDMLLVEKRYYSAGDGSDNTPVQAAGELIRIRNYAQKPLNQYGIYVGTNALNGEENNEDDIGWSSVHEYDWRSREVYTTLYASDQSTALSHTLTWYNNLDRAVLVAEYGGSVPATIDPRLVAPGAAGTDVAAVVAQILSTSAGFDLRSLTEIIYNERGLPEEERSHWRDPVSGTNEYTVSKTYYDHKNRPVWSQSANSAARRMAYDAKDREISSSTVVGTDELTKTTTEYDENDRPTLRTQYERLAGATGAVLDASNSVITYSRSWFDKAGRVTASADYGTANSTDEFTNAANSPSTVETAEDARAAGIARVTDIEYDDEGRQYKTTDPAGRVTLTEFDDLGRAVLTTENADGTSGQQRYTAQKYNDQTGLLEKTAAVRADHFGGGEASFDAINWATTNGTLQVTEYVYGADVTNSDGAGGYVAVSGNGGWIREVHYPDDHSGQPEALPSLTFTYRSDGLVRQRTDARGVELVYDYDDQQRLKSIEAVAIPNSDPLLDPSPSITKLTFDHSDDGMLTTAKSWLGTTLVNETTFAYNELRQVTSTTQKTGTLTDMTVDYTWDNNSTANHNRLKNIQYPNSHSVTLDYGDPGKLDDQLSRVNNITFDGQTAIIYRYMGSGRIVGKKLGNGIAMNYDSGTGGSFVTGLDRYGRVLDIVWANGSPQLELHYGYDTAGNRTKVDAEQHVPDNDWTYGYDELNRLVRASFGTLSSGETFSSSPTVTSWNLDDLGNWSDGASTDSVLHFVDNDLDGIFATPGDTLLSQDHHATNQSNEITTRTLDAVEQAFVYDDAGNLVFNGSYFFRYDAWNRLVSIQEPGALSVDAQGALTGTPGGFLESFEYDALNRKVRSTTSNTRYVYGTGAAVLVELTADANDTPQRRYVHGESFPDPIVMIDETGAGGGTPGIDQAFYYLKDALGSILSLTDATGTVVERYTYTPYGETTIYDANYTKLLTPAYGNTLAYTGQRYDPTTGLYHFWARTYDPETGKWHQRDMMGALASLEVFLGLGSPHAGGPSITAGDEFTNGINLFQYVSSDPIALLDPYGLYEDDIDDLIADLTGQKIYVLASLNEGAKWASLGLNTAAQIALSLIPGYGLYAAYESVEIIRSGRGGLMDYLTVGLAGFSAGTAAVKAIRVVGKAFKWGRRGQTTVYFSRNANGVVQYVGITNDFARRAAEQLRNKGIIIDRLMTKLSRSDARAVEQVLIEIHGLSKKGGTLLNKINSIAKTNPTYAASIKRGKQLLELIGY